LPASKNPTRFVRLINGKRTALGDSSPSRQRSSSVRRSPTALRPGSRGASPTTLAHIGASVNRFNDLLPGLSSSTRLAASVICQPSTYRSWIAQNARLGFVLPERQRASMCLAPPIGRYRAKPLARPRHDFWRLHDPVRINVRSKRSTSLDGIRYGLRGPPAGRTATIRPIFTQRRTVAVETRRRFAASSVKSIVCVVLSSMPPIIYEHAPLSMNI
jgi:hypothetical protein